MTHGGGRGRERKGVKLIDCRIFCHFCNLVLSVYGKYSSVAARAVCNSTLPLFNSF